MTNEGDLAAALEAARRPDGSTVVDMSGVVFLDSSALRAIVRFHTGGNELVVLHPSPPVVRLFELTGLDTVVTLIVTDPR